MKFDGWFNKQNRLIQIILLILPIVGWVTELLVRLSVMLRTKSIVHVVVFLLFLFLGWGIVLQIIDLLFLLFTGHLILAK